MILLPKIDRSLWFEIYYSGRSIPRSDFRDKPRRGSRSNSKWFRSNRCDKVKLSLEPRMNIRSVQIIQKISQSAIFFYLLLRETVRFCHRIISTCQIRLCSQVFKRLVLRCSFSSPLFFLISKFLSSSTRLYLRLFKYCCIKCIY